MSSESFISRCVLLLLLSLSLCNISSITAAQDQTVQEREAKWIEGSELLTEIDYQTEKASGEENEKLPKDLSQEDNINVSEFLTSAMRFGDKMKTKSSQIKGDTIRFKEYEEARESKSGQSDMFLTQVQKDQQYKIKYPTELGRDPNPYNRLQVSDSELAAITTETSNKSMEKEESSEENEVSFLSTAAYDKSYLYHHDAVHTMNLTLNIVRNSYWGEQNIVFSPLSIYNVLALLMLGAEGKTYTEIANVLNLKNISELPHEENSTRFHTAFSKLLFLLHTKSGKNVSIEIANEIFADKQFELKEGYKANANKFYQTPVQSFNFGTDGKVFKDQVNKWVQEKTNGKIKSIVDEPPSPDTTMAFINAVYFRGNWQVPFFEKITRKREFFVKENETIDVQMMTNVLTIPYLDHEEYQMVGIPYKGNRTGFFVILPKSKNGIVSLEKIEKKLSAQDLTERIRTMKPQKIALKLPKMKISTDGHMKEILSSLGMPSAFDSLKANFSKISPQEGLFVSSVHHRAMMEVNEKGTEAAAVTLGTGDRTIDDLPVPFVANKPFVFFIYHIKADTILFWGRVTRPQT